MHGVDLFLDRLGVFHGVLFEIPGRFLFVEFVAAGGQFFFKLREPLLRKRIGLFLQGDLLDLQLHDAASQVVQFGRHRIHFHAQGSAGFIDKVDGLVRQEPVGNIT